MSRKKFRLFAIISENDEKCFAAWRKVRREGAISFRVALRHCAVNLLLLFSLLAQAILVMLLFFAKIGNQRSGEDEHCFFFMNLPPFPLCCRFFAIVYHIFSLVSMCGIADRICAAEKMLDKGRAGQYNKRWISMVVAH